MIYQSQYMLIIYIGVLKSDKFIGKKYIQLQNKTSFEYCEIHVNNKIRRPLLFPSLRDYYEHSKCTDISQKFKNDCLKFLY